MQKLVENRNRKNMNSHVFPKCGNKFLIGTYYKFEVSKGSCANWIMHERASKLISNIIPNSMKINAKTMLEKVKQQISKTHAKKNPK